MFVLTHSQKQSEPAIIFQNGSLVVGEQQLVYLKIMRLLCIGKPIVCNKDNSCYKKIIQGHTCCGDMFISNNKDSLQRRLPIFFCLQDNEQIDQLDQDIQSIGKMGYHLSEQEISAIKKILIAAKKKYTLSFIISLIIMKIIKFFKGE